MDKKKRNKFKKIQGSVKNQKFYKPQDDNRISQGPQKIVYWNTDNYGSPSDNAYPDFLINIYETAGTSIHSNLINLKSRMIRGDNLSVADPDDPNASKSLEFIEKRNRRFENLKSSWSFNSSQYALFEQAYLQVVYSKDWTTASIYSIPVKNVRAEALNDWGEIENFYISSRWNELSRKPLKNNWGTASPRKVPAYTGIKKAKELNQRVQMLQIRKPDYSSVYTTPSWAGGMNWILISNYVSNFHLNNFKNNYFIQGILVTYGQMDEDVEDQFIEEMEELFMGAADADQKKLMYANVQNKDMKPDFVSARDLMQDKEFDSLINQANQQVIFAHSAYSSLAGMDSKGSDLGGDANKLNNQLKAFKKFVTDPMKEELLAGYNMIMDDLDLPLLDVDTTNLFIDFEEKEEKPETSEGVDIDEENEETPDM